MITAEATTGVRSGQADCEITFNFRKENCFYEIKQYLYDK